MPSKNIILESADEESVSFTALARQMCITGLKKINEIGFNKQKFDGVYELDELYWFVERKGDTQTRENVYLMTMISREPRQIVSFTVARDKCAWRIQKMVDKAPKALNYYSDGYIGYCDVDYFGGEYVRNCRDKSDTHNVESINADLRHYIPVLRRRSSCFCRSLETLDAVISLFVEAYNKFGEYKLKYRRPTLHKSPDHAMHLHKFKELGCSLLDFL